MRREEKKDRGAERDGSVGRNGEKERDRMKAQGRIEKKSGTG